MKKQREEEDPESEEVLERERKKQSASDDWKDWNPKGSGVSRMHTPRRKSVRSHMPI